MVRPAVVAHPKSKSIIPPKGGAIVELFDVPLRRRSWADAIRAAAPETPFRYDVWNVELLKGESHNRDGLEHAVLARFPREKNPAMVDPIDRADKYIKGQSGLLAGSPRLCLAVAELLKNRQGFFAEDGLPREKDETSLIIASPMEMRLVNLEESRRAAKNKKEPSVNVKNGKPFLYCVRRFGTRMVAAILPAEDVRWYTGVWYVFERAD